MCNVCGENAAILNILMKFDILYTATTLTPVSLSLTMCMTRRIARQSHTTQKNCKFCLSHSRSEKANGLANIR